MMTAPHLPRLNVTLDEWSGGDGVEVEIEDVIVNAADFMSATRFEASGARLDKVALTGAVLTKCELMDVECSKLEAAALGASGANLLRVRMADSRCTGAEFGEGLFTDCLFRNVKFDQAGFRFARFERVRFENCVLRRADFGNATFKDVVFTGCDLEDCSFMSATCKNVDVSGEDITVAKSILGLKGATISAEQLIQLAPLLAAELGFIVKDEA